MSGTSAAGRSPSWASIADVSADALRSDILDGVLAPGESVTESALIERLRVSRTPVREALAQLESEGLLVRRNRRLTVVELSAQEITDVYEIRIPIESIAARRAAVRAGVECATELDRILAMTRHDDARGDRGAVYRTARSFHDTIRSYSGNPVLERTLRQLQDRTSHYRLSRRRTTDTRLASCLDEHIELTSTIRRGDGDAAERLMQQHLSCSCAFLAKQFDRDGAESTTVPGPDRSDQTEG